MISIPYTRYVVLRKSTIDMLNSRLFGYRKQLQDYEDMLVEKMVGEDLLKERIKHLEAYIANRLK